MVVREIMSRDVAAVDAESSILDAAVKMKLYDIGMLLVSNAGRLVGVVTDRDIVIRGVAEGADPTFFLVKSLMTTELVCCRENDTVERAAQLMQAAQVRRMIVLGAGDEPVGVVSLGDLARQAGDVCLAGSVLEKVAEPSEAEAVRPHREG